MTKIYNSVVSYIFKISNTDTLCFDCPSVHYSHIEQALAQVFGDDTIYVHMPAPPLKT